MKKVLSVFIAIIMIFTITEPIANDMAVRDIALSASASGVDNIVARAYYMYNSTWVCQKQVSGWDCTFQKGNTYRIPYGQPATAGKYIGFQVSVPEYLNAAQNANSIFYTSQSYYSGSVTRSTYYASDCSAFVSYCWGIGRTTTSNWSNLNVTSLGSASSVANLDKLQPGDALNHAGDHIVLVIAVNGNNVEIMQQTPPQLRKDTFTKSEIAAKYSNYTIYRYNNRDNVPPPPSETDPSLQEPVVTTNKDTYGIGETINISWVPSPSGSNLSHYWLQIFAPDGSTALNQTMNLQTSYSYKVTQSGTYRIVAWATPKGSVEGEGSLISEKKITVVKKPTVSKLSASASSITSGGSITFTATSDTATSYYIGIDKDGVRKITQNMPNGKLTLSFSEVGTYSAYVTSSNASGGLDSAKIQFTVTPKNVTITLDGNGGTVSKTSFSVSVGSKLDGLNSVSASKTGYTFSGWFTDKSGGTQMKATDTASKALTLYAHWTPKSVNVTFHRNQNSSDTSTVQESFTYGVANQKFGYKTDGTGRYESMNNASVGFGKWNKTGYSMLGWSHDKNASSSTYGTYSSVSNDWINSYSSATDLYAIWKPNTYKVTLNDGSDKTTEITVTYDGKYNVPDAKKDGYNFAGWYTEKDGKGTLISKETTVKITAAQTLYACWKKEVFQITFNTNGGTTELTDKLLSYDTKYGYLPDATKQGYEFGGWYLDEAFTQQITAESIVKIKKAQEVYAKWTQVIPTITFDANGGTTDMETKQVVMGKNYGILPDAEKDGFDFAGWFTEDGTEITSESIVEVSEDITVYAKWRIKGDADADGDVDIDDVIMLQQWLLAVPDAPLTDWQAVDLYQDEKIDVFDLSLLKRLLLERNGEGK